MTETPTQAIVKAANETKTVTDERGRVIVFRSSLGILDKMKLFEAAGSTLSENEQWLSYAAMAFLAKSVDGVPVARPNNRQMIDAAISLLGDEGVVAIALGRMERDEPAAE